MILDRHALRIDQFWEEKDVHRIANTHKMPVTKTLDTPILCLLESFKLHTLNRGRMRMLMSLTTTLFLVPKVNSRLKGGRQLPFTLAPAMKIDGSEMHFPCIVVSAMNDTGSISAYRASRDARFFQ